MASDMQRGQASGASNADRVFRHSFSVPESAIDQNGHVNNVAYVQWMQDVAIRHFEASGCADAPQVMGGTWVARSHRIDYLRPAFLGDSIEARTWVAALRRVRSTRRYEFVRLDDGAVLARGETDWVFVGAETGRPMTIPDVIRDAFLTHADAQNWEGAEDYAEASGA